MNIKIFTQENCPNCPAVKAIGEKLEKEGCSISYNDIMSIEGLSESVYHNVLSTPSIVIVDDNNNELHSWRTDVPKIDEILEKLKT